MARDAARKSIVLLKNDNHLLPLSKNIKSIAVIGPLGDAAIDMLGGWRASGDPTYTITMLAGLRNRLGDHVKITYEKGCEVNGESKAEFQKAIMAARKADIVLFAMGEYAHMSGENQSRAYINIPGVQEELMKEILETGKPAVLLLFNGRPLTISWEKEKIPAILECWFPGIEAGNAIADILFGDYDPSAKLVMSFPVTVGQVPIYYNHKNTGRAYIKENHWGSHYIDVANEPLYCFGYGLSYTQFEYSGITLSDSVINMKDTLQVSVNITNTGQYAGEEIAQLYIRDMVASVTRPVKELKGFRKIKLQPGESKKIRFTITGNDLCFWNKNMKFVAEPGEFKVYVGTNSQDVKESEFRLK
jgi:beta-glucosidase